jgi:hypothetical protein
LQLNQESPPCRHLPGTTASLLAMPVPTQHATLVDWYRNLPRQTIIDPYRFLDWLMRLPEDLELQYTNAIPQAASSRLDLCFTGKG